MKVFLSKAFITAVKLGKDRAYKVAQINGVDPTFISKAMNRIVEVKRDDPRILKIANYLDVPRDMIFDVSNLNVTGGEDE